MIYVKSSGLFADDFIDIFGSIAEIVEFPNMSAAG